MNYAGFWERTAASIINTFLMLVLTLPFLYLIYGGDYFTLSEEDGTVVRHGVVDLFFSYIFPMIFTFYFWMKFAAAPGKMAQRLKVVDAKTGEDIKFHQTVLRYIGYFISAMPMCLGFLWVAFDGRKQGRHDKIAGTVVVRQ